MTKKNIELNRVRRLLKKKIRRSRKALRDMSLALRDVLEDVDDYDENDVARVMRDVDNIYPVASVPSGAVASSPDEPPDLEFTPIQGVLHQNPDDDDDDFEDNPDDDDDDDLEDNPDDEDDDDEE